MYSNWCATELRRPQLGVFRKPAEYVPSVYVFHMDAGVPVQGKCGVTLALELRSGLGSSLPRAFCTRVLRPMLLHVHRSLSPPMHGIVSHSRLPSETEFGVTSFRVGKGNGREKVRETGEVTVAQRKSRLTGQTNRKETERRSSESFGVGDVVAAGEPSKDPNTVTVTQKQCRSDEG